MGSPINYKYKNSSEKRNDVGFNGVNVAKNWHVAGEIFAISDCLVINVFV